MHVVGAAATDAVAVTAAGVAAPSATALHGAVNGIFWVEASF